MILNKHFICNNLNFNIFSMHHHKKESVKNLKHKLWLSQEYLKNRLLLFICLTHVLNFISLSSVCFFKFLFLSVKQNKKIRSILFVFPADSRANSDKGAAKAEFHMMQMLWNAFPGVKPAKHSAGQTTHRHMGRP